MSDSLPAPFDVKLMNMAASALFMLCGVAVLAAGAWWVLRNPAFAIGGIVVQGEVTHNNAIKNMVHQVVLLKDGQIHKNYRNEVRTPAACITPCRSWASGCRACCWYMHW